MFAISSKHAIPIFNKNHIQSLGIGFFTFEKEIEVADFTFSTAKLTGRGGLFLISLTIIGTFLAKLFFPFIAAY